MSEWKDTRLPKDHCPVCDEPISAAGSPDSAFPKPGDLSVCFKCASPLSFNDDISLRELSPAEMRKLHPESAAMLRRYMRAVRETNRR